MSLSIYTASVPVFIRGLEVLGRLLAKAKDHAAEHGIDPQDLVQARLAPDMYNLAEQVQRTSDTSKMTTERLGGGPAPKMADDETTLEQLQDRVQRTIAYLRGVDPVSMEGAESLTLTLPFGDIPPFTGESFLLTFGLPNFFFHVVTAHDILRSKGVKIGKLDYLGPFGVS
jgi:hypothetical protein